MTPYILNLLDYALTLIILNTGGMELNPAMSAAMRLPMLFPFVKIVLAGILCLWLERKAQTHSDARVGLRVIAAFYAVVCLWNVLNIIVWRAAV